MNNCQISSRKLLLSNQMVKAKAKQKTIKLLVAFFVIFLIVLIIIKPNVCISSTYAGLAVWAKTVLPSLLPFVFLTKLLSGLNVMENLTKYLSKVIKILFKAPAISSYIFLMSIISGYPVGSKLISEFYCQGKLTQKQATKLITFCSTSGPLFIIGSVGTAMFLDKKIGYILFFSHVLSSILNGILFRNKWVDNTQSDVNFQKDCNLAELLPNTMTDTVLSCLIVGGYIAIFFVMIDIFSGFGLLNPISDIFCKILSPLGATKSAVDSTLFGLIEISKGCIQIAKSGISTLASASIASFLISFGGICTFFQATTFLSKCKVSAKFYLFQKLTHGVLSATITFLIMKFVF